ncbi:MAG: hypothetical protein IJA53_02585 [Spirochaetaceae bacterium]|nr:hypothetical protein [Spirochaetaceae bacterium]
METWSEVRKYILDNYEFAEYDEKEDVIVIGLIFKDWRTQQVFVTRINDSIMIFSLIGEINRNDLLDILNDDDLRYCIKRNGKGEYFLSQFFSINVVSEKLLDETISNIAASADEIERKYIGEDAF